MIGLCATFSLLAVSFSKPAPVTAIVGARLLDSQGLREGQTVLLQGGKILAVGRLTVPPGARKIEAQGKTLLPGFIDAHVHLQLSDPAACLRGGVTTVRDLGWEPQSILGRQSELRRQGPYLLAAGAMFCQPDGYPTQAGWCPPGTAYPVGNSRAAQRGVEAMAVGGASVIKVTLPFPQLKLVVSEAHRRKLKVTAHLTDLKELDQALEAGVDELAHFTFAAVPVPPDRLERMVRQKVGVCPTLHINPHPQRLDNVGKVVAAGGIVIYGTDLGNVGPPPGIDVEELEYMRQAGMTHQQVINSATSVSAAWMGLPDRGRIAPGLRADLILVQGDPLQDLRALQRPRQVIYGGAIL